MSRPRFITHSYDDGRVITSQHDPLMDGPWPFANDVFQVEIKHITLDGKPERISGHNREKSL